MEFEFQNLVEYSAVSRLTFIIRVNFRKMDPDPYSRSAGQGTGRKHMHSTVHTDPDPGAKLLRVRIRRTGKYSCY